MRIEYRGSTDAPLTQILTEHQTKPIDFVFLDEDEFDEMFEDAKSKGMINNSSESWFTIKSSGIVFYLEAC